MLLTLEQRHSKPLMVANCRQLFVFKYPGLCRRVSVRSLLLSENKQEQHWAAPRLLPTLESIQEWIVLHQQLIWVGL